MIFVPAGVYKITEKQVFDEDWMAYIFGASNGAVDIITDTGVTFNLFEIGETKTPTLFHLDNLRFDHYSTGSTFKFYNVSELQLDRCEFRGDSIESDNIIIEPNQRDIKYLSIRECFLLGGATNTKAQLNFSNAGGYQVDEIMIHHCWFKPQYLSGGTPRTSPIIVVEDDAIDRWMIDTCRFELAGGNPILDIKGKIGSGGIGGINSIQINALGSDATHSRLIHFNDLATINNAYVKISGLMCDPQPTANLQAYYGVYIGDNWDYIQVIGNSFPNMKTEEVYVASGANVHGRIENNLVTNPFGIITNPFDTTNDLIHLTGDSASPSASTAYTVCLAPCRIISSDSSNANCSIEVKDKDGNSIESGLSTYDGWLEPGWTINWGAFTGTAPTVKVVFK
jgi:hypothetical protein